MNHEPQIRSISRAVRLMLSALALLSVALTSLAVGAQSSGPPTAGTVASTRAGGASQSSQAPGTANSDLTQMRTDLDRMESLLGNMSSEIEFLRDQNLQILLRTNAQMWRMLISDLRRQVDREERRAQR